MLRLIDFGSTHNFSSSIAAQQLALNVRSLSNTEVSIANGEQVKSLGVCSQILISIEGQDFTTDFYVIPLGGFDMVLGVK